MKAKCIVSLFSAFVFFFGSALAWAAPPSQFPQDATYNACHVAAGHRPTD